MLKILIVDDDEMSLETLKDRLQLKHKGQVAKIFCARNVKEARRYLKSEKINVVFLDVEMPGENGFDLLSSLDEINFFIVFTTAHSHYAIKAIKTGAIDYLMKPLKALELELVMKRIDELIGKIAENGLKAGQVKQSSGIAKLYDVYRENNAEKDSIIVPHQSGVKIFLFNDIMRIEGDGNYSKIFDVAKTSLLTSKTLKYFVTKLSDDNNFYRAHKSTVINVKYVKELYKENFSNYAKMADGASVEISRRAYSGLVEKIALKSK